MPRSERSRAVAHATPSQIELATRLRMAFALITRAQRQDGRSRLTAAQLSALHRVDVRGPLRLGVLAEGEKVASPTMSRVVASLVSLGYATRTSDPASARSSLVAVTKEGRRILDVLRRDRSDEMACRLACLSLPHQKLLRDALPALEALVGKVVPDDDWPREVERVRDAQRRRSSRRGG